jgi:pyruvate dehydrogenase E1 component
MWTTEDEVARAARVACLGALERKALWLATWMIHNANHLRPKRDGLKVGGHQASSASLATLMTALYLDVLRPEDRVAVKPHASPLFHALSYLLGQQDRAKLERFRAFGGAQAYPSRTKDGDDVDFSTGSVGLGAATTCFAALVQDYLCAHGRGPAKPGRMIALVGDAELDEGNVFEALLEGWKHDLRDVWWIVDYNRQSLDATVEDRLHQRIDALFAGMGWRVVTLKYGRRLQAAFEQAGGAALRAWIDRCPNALYGALVYRGGAAWRERLEADVGREPGVSALLDAHDDAALAALMTNLGGHDLPTILEALHGAAAGPEAARPTCFLAYTVKGHGLPLAGHKDNHAGQLTPEQVDELRLLHRVPPGQEWERFAGLDLPAEQLEGFLAEVPFIGPPSRSAARAATAASPRRHCAPLIAAPGPLASPGGERSSTQEGFGRLLRDLAREQPALADRIVTTSPDVAVSTNLGAWINARGVFAREARPDAAAGVASPQRWTPSPQGQHLELGIAENNLFLMLAALGLAGPLFGERLIPIGTVYDPFIARGLDALNYACYSDARFILVATPSGLTLGPEGGAHQSISTPLIGMGQPNLTAFEPAFVDELAAILGFAFSHLQAPDGSAVYLRLSTRPLPQPARALDVDAVLAGGYWLVPPGPRAEVAIACAGAVVAEAEEALALLAEDHPDAGLLVVTSADRLHAGFCEARSASPDGGELAARPPCHAERLLAQLPDGASVVTILDGHPATLSWLGSVRRHRVAALGVQAFGQSGDLVDLYRHYGLDAAAIVDAVARLRAAGVRARVASARPARPGAPAPCFL